MLDGRIVLKRRCEIIVRGNRAREYRFNKFNSNLLPRAMLNSIAKHFGIGPDWFGSGVVFTDGEGNEYSLVPCKLKAMMLERRDERISR